MWPPNVNSTQFHPFVAIHKTSKPSRLALEFLLYTYMYIEIAIAVTDGFAATQATAEHATNVVLVSVANKTKSEGSEKKVNDFYTLFSRLAQRVFNAVYKAIYHHFISFPLCMWFVCVTRVKDHGKERMEIS